MEGHAARYTHTITYAKTALTLSETLPRFVRPQTALHDGRTWVMTNGSVRVSVFGKTDLGRTREHNEDTFLVADLSTGNASLQPEVRSHEIGPRGSLFMVADGMGGAAAGELASAMAADLIHRHMATAWASDSPATASQFAYRMKEAVELANAKIYSYAREHPEVRGMGTTVTAAGVYRGDLYLTQIGDSRAYLVRGAEAIQLTKDQSLMQRLVDAGELTEDEAEQSERRNIILQALGPDPRVKVDLTYQSIRRGDVLILCSDGLSGLVRREEFASLARQHPEPPGLCAALIDLANARGGPDNITVVTARFDGEGLPQAEGAEGVGYQNYELPPAGTRSEAGSPHQTDSTPATASESSLILDRLRNLGLIAILLGVLMLLLAVWR
jgi:serine/threonine protein phosphatase PrpC